MKDAIRPEVLGTLVQLGLLAFSASLAVWGWTIRRAIRREPVISYQPRHPAPWHAIDLALIFMFYVLTASAVVELDRHWFPGVANPPAEADEEVEPSTEHDVLVLLREDRNLGTLALCLIAAVIVAPITEEMFFRLFLQGWLEGLEWHWRPGTRILRGTLRGALPVLGSSLAFALPHFRQAGMPPSAQAILHILVCSSLVKMATTVFALALVRVRVGAKAVDLGFRHSEWFRDVAMGLGTGVAVVPWLYVLQVGLANVLPESVSPDPFTLVPFAVVLGLLYYRTHRIIPSIVLHMVLNATSLALAWYALA